jgi:hypothetical protein
LHLWARHSISIHVENDLRIFVETTQFPQSEKHLVLTTHRLNTGRRPSLSLIVAGLLTLVPIVQASPSPPVPSASSIIRQWRAAVHRHYGERAGTVHLSFSATEDGLQGSVDEWVTSEGEYRRSTLRQFDRNDIVLTPDRAQTRDWNNYVRELDGTELQRLRSQAFAEQVMIFGPPVALKAAEVRETPDLKYWTLQFRPFGSLPITWYVDKQTSLPLKAVFAGPEDWDINTAYDEWHTADDAIYLYHVSISEADKSISEYRLSRSLHTLSADAAVFAPFSPGASDVVMNSEAVTLPFTLEGNHIILQAQVNGSPPIGFILDTGDDHETINVTRMASFGLTSYGSIHTEGGGGPADMSFAAGATFTFLGFELRDQHVTVLDQSGLERALGIPLGGILGYDFLSRFVVEVNYDSKTMTLHNSNGWKYSGKGAIVPITFDDGIPYFDAVLSVPTKLSLAAHMVMDFGAADTMTFTSPFVKANELIKLAGTNTHIATSPGLEGQFFTQSNMRGHIDELHLGGLVARSIPVSLSANSEGAYASPNFAGTVGEGIFSRYHVFIDYARHRVIFEDTSKTDAAFPERKTFGLSLVASGVDLHTFTISAVRPGSAAESAGFRKGDVITGFDDRQATQFSLGELRDWLLREDERHLFQLIRDKQKVSISAAIVLVSIDRTDVSLRP